MIKIVQSGRKDASFMVIFLGFLFRPAASAPWMVKGVSPLQLSHGGRAPDRKEKAQGGKNLKNRFLGLRV
jgi:hypothetical protein